MQKKIVKFNSFFLGLIPALILPLISMYVFFLIKFSKNKSFSEFIDIIQSHNVTTKVLSLCVIPNLLLFFIFIWSDRYTPAKGVIFATLVYTFTVLIMKEL